MSILRPTNRSHIPPSDEKGSQRSQTERLTSSLPPRRLRWDGHRGAGSAVGSERQGSVPNLYHGTVETERCVTRRPRSDSGLGS